MPFLLMVSSRRYPLITYPSVYRKGHEKWFTYLALSIGYCVLTTTYLHGCTSIDHSKANLSISEILKYVHTKALEPLDMNNVGLLSRKMSKMSISQYLKDFVRCTKGMRFLRSTRQGLMEIEILSIFF